MIYFDVVNWTKPPEDSPIVDAREYIGGGMARLKGGQAELDYQSCTLHLARMDGNTWSVSDSGDCVIGRELTFSGIYKASTPKHRQR
jgi:hypothetical protein